MPPSTRLTMIAHSLLVSGAIFTPVRDDTSLSERMVAIKSGLKWNFIEKNCNVSNIIIILYFSIINNPKILIFSACMEIFNNIQVVGHIISLTSINNNTSRRDFIPFYRAVSTPQISGGDLLNLLLEYENKGEERNMPRDQVCCSCNIWCRRLFIHF